MRLFILNLLFTTGLLLLGASTASALSISLSATTPTTILIGETVTVKLYLDTGVETQVTSVFTSVGNDNPSALSFTSGTSPGAILMNMSTFEGVPRVSQPTTGVAGDAAGRVRAANFATATPTGSGVSSANQLLATLIFTGDAAGSIDLAPLLVTSGSNLDEFTVAHASVAGSVSLGGPVTITVIPEPGTALLMGLGLAGLAAAGRRRIA
jgi:hypothetical protein